MQSARSGSDFGMVNAIVTERSTDTPYVIRALSQPGSSGHVWWAQGQGARPGSCGDRMLREMIAAPKVAARNTFAGNLLTT
jgi:hypothetical protein